MLGYEHLLVEPSTLYRRNHHLRKGFFASRLSYYSNSTATFQQANLLLSGDVAVNPGPNKTQSNNRSTLRFFYQNARSIKSGSKLREFQDTVYTNNFDVIAISETWLTCEISDSEILPWGYDIHRCDRADVLHDNTSGGGVLLASRCSLRCQPVIFDIDIAIEHSAIEIINNCGKTLIAVFYRPPSANNTWINQFIEFIDICSYDKVIIVGDFNLPNITWIDGSGFTDSNPTLFTFCEKLIDKNIFQLINQPTRGNNTLDLLLSSFVEGVTNIHLTDSEGVALCSDHKALTFDLQIKYKSKTNNNQQAYNFKKANFNELREKLRASPLPTSYDYDHINETTIDVIWTEWLNEFLSKVDLCIPKRKPRKFVPPPWIDGEVTHAIRKKNSARKKALCKNSETLWEKYRQHRREVKYLVRSKRTAYMKNISDNAFSHPKRFWSFFNRLSNRPSIPDTITDGDSTFTSPESKAEAFNNYFASVFNPLDNLPANIDTPYTDNIITDIVIRQEEVLEALQKLNPSKSPGPDLIHPRILKECAEELAPSLCALFNLSLHLGKLPLEWKRSNVVPVFKKGVKSAISNYRPISLLSIVSKLCERCVLRELVSSLSSLLCPEQHGFTLKKCCVTQLLTVLQDLGSALDAGEETDVLYLDFSKAFDSVPHNLLLHKLSLYGIAGSLHAWLSDYLASRFQRVLVEGCLSSWVKVTSGVPQGSLLGPMLFILYVNDLPRTVSKGTSIALFADDAKCFRTLKSDNDYTMLQNDIDNLYDWSLNWGLSYNLDKCVVMRISRKRISSVPSLAVSPYVAGGCALAVVPSQKDLGVTITNKLTWNVHIECVVAKANRMLGFLRRNCANIGTDSKRTLYMSFVRSHLGYASEVWAPQSAITSIRLIESVQRRATRFILNCSFDVSKRPNYKARLISLRLLPLSYWHEYRDLCFFYKCMNGYYNININSYISLVSSRTRSASKNNLRPNQFRTSLFRDSFFNRIVTLWNALPVDIRTTQALSSFKNQLYKLYFDKLLCVFDTERIQTWKTVCPHCRSLNRINCC